MKLNTIFMATAVAALSSFANAEGTKPQGSGPSPYTECGIGAALFPETHWAAATSNVTWDLGTTALTSATSSPETCNAKKVKTAQFILDTYENLVEETAAGSGEHLTAALTTFGCSTSDHQTISSELRQAFSAEINKPDYAELSDTDKANKYYQALNLSSKGRCSA